MAINITNQNFENEVLKSDIPVLADFWAPWCGPCRALAPVMEKLHDKLQGKAKICKINVDENPDLAAKYNIRGIPSVLAFKDGKNTDMIVGLEREDRYVKALNL